MIRFVTIGIFSILLGLILVPTSSMIGEYLNVIGIFLLAISSGLYLKNIRLAGALTLLSSGIILQNIWHWWYIYIMGPLDLDKVGDMAFKIVSIYILSTIAYIIMVIIGITSILKGHSFNYKFDQISFSKLTTLLLGSIPTLIVIASLIIYQSLL